MLFSTAACTEEEGNRNETEINESNCKYNEPGVNDTEQPGID